MARLCFALLALVALGASHSALAHKEAMTGGVRDAKTDDPHAVEAAMFAVDALNDGHKLRSELNDVGGLLTYVRVKDVRQQLVAGMLYFMTVVVTDSHGAEHEFTCKVWSRPWLKNANGGDQSMQLSDVKYVRPSASSA